jgi:phage tail sheath protein FI
MAEYHTPGVYVEEVQAGPRPIQAASTTTAAILGEAPNADADVNVPRACNNWSEFVKYYFPDGSSPTNLAYAVYGFFMNGGGRCYVVNLGKGGTVAGDARKGTGIHALNAYDEPSMVLAPGYTGAADYRALIDHAEKYEDRVAILDAPARVDDVKDLTEAATAEPAPAGGTEEQAGGRSRAAAAKSKSQGAPRSNYAAIYYPWLMISGPFGEGKLVEVPPSGHIAGIYAMNDVRRGVHKAPANYPVRTAIGLTDRITHEEQGVLNDAGVNCIRHMPDQTIKVWGARTLADDAQWRYINVRRLINMIKESIEDGSSWVVFEPNDTSTRNAVAFNCRAFLKLQWLAGALVGDTPEQAFFVKCDGENNPPEVVDAGRLIIDIGVAPSKPAEFVIFRIAQWRGGTESQAAA